MIHNSSSSTSASPSATESEGPLVSICIPAYKAERFIAETLHSIAAQSHQNWEAIIVEDGSMDGTEKIVADFKESVSQRVHFQRQEKNQGLPATRNTAIASARGEWIALIDSDDIWTPDHLAKLVARALSTQADLIHSGVVMFDSDTGQDQDTRTPSAQATAELPRSLFLGAYIIQPSSTLIRTSLCREVKGFDPTCRYVEDREFWIRLVRAGAKIAYEPTISCRYRQHASAMTKNAAAMAEGVAGVFERHIDWEAMPLSLRKERTADAWFSAGRISLRGDPRRARKNFSNGLRHAPFSPRLIAYWLVAAITGIFKTSRT